MDYVITVTEDYLNSEFELVASLTPQQRMEDLENCIKKIEEYRMAGTESHGQIIPHRIRLEVYFLQNHNMSLIQHRRIATQAEHREWKETIERHQIRPISSK